MDAAREEAILQDLEAIAGLMVKVKGKMEADGNLGPTFKEFVTEHMKDSASSLLSAAQLMMDFISDAKGGK